MATWLRSAHQSDGMSPDQSSAPYFCEPAHALRESETTFVSPSARSPS